MASITKQRVGIYTYLYDSVSYRDDKGRPRNKKRRIGKIDPHTGETIYDADYLAEIDSSGDSTADIGSVTEKPAKIAKGVSAQILSSVKSYGALWFLRGIAQQVGLWETLQQAFPRYWQEIFTLACHLILSDKPVMYCEDWLADQVWLDVGCMSSQRISDLLIRFDEVERNEFFRIWCKFIEEREYIALDMTSISSYSQQIQECEWGYNRDGESLPQVNLCMLYGSTSRLPVFQINYAGSLKDVSCLQSAISGFKAVLGDRPILTVMDKGFFSEKNVAMLLGKKVPFLISVPFTGTFIRQQVSELRNTIDQASNMIRTRDGSILGVRRECIWGSTGQSLNIHVFHNQQAALKEKRDLYEYVSDLREFVLGNHHKRMPQKDIDRYLIIHKPEGERIFFTVEINEVNVAKALENAGWFVLISDYIENTQFAYDAYRLKDGVEKSFWKYKNSLGLDRLRVHGDHRMLNKTFVAFVALILSSHIHKTLSDKGLYKLYTFDKLILAIFALKSATVGDQSYISPVTKKVRDIFDAFGLDLPVG